MVLSDLVITVEVRRRSFFGRLRQLPRAFRQHYRIFRLAHGRLVSAYGAWLLAGVILSFPRRKDTAC